MKNVTGHQLPCFICFFVLIFILGLWGAQAESPAFKKLHLLPSYWSEGANFADLDKDGHMDIVCGPHWFRGPEYKERFEFYPAVGPRKRHRNDVSVYTLDNFFSFIHDCNADGWLDIITVGLPGTEAFWYENPGDHSLPARDLPPHWKKHFMLSSVDNESPRFGDLTGDGEPELICMHQGEMGFATPDKKDPTKPWEFHAVSSGGKWSRYVHGLGYGDLNGDGRADLFMKDGWWEQPASLDGDPVWKSHPYKFADRGGAQMFAYDVDADGDNDIVTSLNGHGWGLSWFEQVKKGGEIDFKEHLIMGEKPEENPYGVAFSLLHAVSLVDIDGDGLKDIVTGKCYRAHDFRDPGGREPPVLYWFKLDRQNGKVEFIPHLIDDDSGVGRQLVTGDIDGDGKVDMVIGNKKGTFVFLQTNP